MWRYTSNVITAAIVLLSAAAIFVGVFFLYKYYINQRLKGRFKKFSLPRISVIVMAFTVFVSAFMGGYFLDLARRDSNHRLYARIGYLRAENAQYVPDIFKLPQPLTEMEGEINGDGTLSPDYKKFKTMAIDVSVANYADLVDMLGVIESPYNPDFTVLTLKEEIKTVFNNVTVFNRWVKMKEGKLSGIGEYYLTYSEKLRCMTVLRKRTFEPWVWDNAKQESIQISHTIFYKMDFGYNENGVETFECEMFSVLNAPGSDYIRQYQYIKNVRDTSFTKYIISPLTVIDDGAERDVPLYETDSDNTYGTERRFVQLDYSGGKAVMLFVNQVFTSAYNRMPDMTSVKLFAGTPQDLTMYNTVFSSDIAKYPNRAHEVFFNGAADGLVEMYCAQDLHRTTSYGLTGNYTPSFRTLFSNEITYQEREILYKNANEVTVFNNFNGTGQTFSTAAAVNMAKLEGAYGYLNDSLSSFARNFGCAASPLSAPISSNVTETVFENALQNVLQELTQKAVDNTYLKDNYDSLVKQAAKFIYI